MRTFVRRWSMIAGIAMILQSCSHARLDEVIDQKLAQETDVRPGTIKRETTEVIKNAPDLDDQQKTRLLALRDVTDQHLKRMKEQSLKLHSILIKELVSMYYDPDEVDLIKKRIKKIENEKVSMIFKSIEQANLILGRKAHGHRKIVTDIFGDRITPE